jgi:signal transduction histidine kinase
MGREADLETALGNLVENAVRAGPPGEPIEIHLGRSARGDRALVEVRDRGPGVPASLRPRIFERFFTTDPDRGGTGLGLAIVTSVATAHGGSVRCEGEEGAGATFVLDLPLGDRPQGPAPKPNEPP